MENKVKFSLNEFLDSISFTLDYGEKDMLNRITNHSRRVAYIATHIAMALKFHERDIFETAALAILHDCGSGGANYKAAKGDFLFHCLRGEEIVSGIELLPNSKNVVLYHHEFEDGSGFFGKKGDEIPIKALVISLANLVETLYNKNEDSIEDIVKLIQSYENTKFSSTLINAFVSAQNKVSFWIDIEDLFIRDALKQLLPNFIINVSYKDIHKLTAVISEIIDSKSRFTREHSSGLTHKVQIATDFYQLSEDIKYQLMIAANLHDIGKLAISNDILDKNGKLTAEEFNIIKRHPYYTKKALECMESFSNIANWASQHHEKLNGTGYPLGLQADQIDFQSRLMTCLDIYQALTEERPYRDGLVHEEAISIMKEMSYNGEIDSKIVDDINGIFQ